MEQLYLLYGALSITRLWIVCVCARIVALCITSSAAFYVLALVACLLGRACVTRFLLLFVCHTRFTIHTTMAGATRWSNSLLDIASHSELHHFCSCCRLYGIIRVRFNFDAFATVVLLRKTLNEWALNVRFIVNTCKHCLFEKVRRWRQEQFLCVFTSNYRNTQNTLKSIKFYPYDMK